MRDPLFSFVCSSRFVESDDLDLLLPSVLCSPLAGRIASSEISHDSQHGSTSRPTFTTSLISSPFVALPCMTSPHLSIFSIGRFALPQSVLIYDLLMTLDLHATAPFCPRLAWQQRE